MPLDLDIGGLQAGKTPLASRGNPIIYAVIAIGIVFILAAIGIWVAGKFLKKYHNSTKYIENQKSKITTGKDVKIFAQKYQLPRECTSFLQKFIKTFKIPNILYSIKEIENYDAMFKSCYKELKKRGNEKLIGIFFETRFALEKICASLSIIKSTRGIPVGSIIFIVSKDGSKLNLKIKSNTQDFMVCDPPEDFESSFEKPNPLEKYIFTLTTPSRMSYGFVSRIIRYQKSSDGKTELIVAHPAELYVQQNRSSKRKGTAEDTTFRSVIIDKEKGKIITGEKSYDGVVTNISSSGCCIRTALPIKENQYLTPELVNFGITDQIVGKIVKTRNTVNNGMFNLHIKFEKISLESKNRINASIYGYDI